MQHRKQFVSDLLFGVQIVCGIVFGIGQIVRLLQTTQGVNVSWFIFWQAFNILNLKLAERAYAVQPSRVMRQTLTSYVMWTVLVTAMLVIVGVQGNAAWDQKDSITAAVVLTGVATIVVVARLRQLTVYDPIVRGVLAVACKGIPQLALAYKIALVGGAGIPAITVFLGHVTILSRLGQLGFAIAEAGWDRNRIGSAISELSNEGSWLVTTAVWFVA